MAERGQGEAPPDHGAPAARWSIPAVLLASAAIVLSGLVLRLLIPAPPPDEQLRETVRTLEQLKRDFPNHRDGR